MITLKRKFKYKNIKSDSIFRITKKYSLKKLIKISLYCIEDCIHLTNSQHSKECYKLIKKWKFAKKKHLKSYSKFLYNWHNSGYVEDLLATVLDMILEKSNYLLVVFHLAHFADRKGFKYQEYFDVARLHAQEDPNYKFKKFAKTFDLDNDVDLNVFLDFLTDNYPDALTYSREEFLSNKFAREYLKVIYQ